MADDLDQSAVGIAKKARVIVGMDVWHDRWRAINCMAVCSPCLARLIHGFATIGLKSEMDVRRRFAVDQKKIERVGRAETATRPVELLLIAEGCQHVGEEA